MAKKSEVPDPKSGRDSSPQNTNAVQQYTEEILLMSSFERMNEKKALKAETAFIRQAMNQLQSSAGHERRVYGIVTESLREALVASRNVYRLNQVKIRAFNEAVKGLDPEDLEEE